MSMISYFGFVIIPNNTSAVLKKDWLGFLDDSRYEMTVLKPLKEMNACYV